MAYDKNIWEGLPSRNTPFTPARMNHLENGVEDVDNRLTNATTHGSSSEIIIGTFKGKPVYRKTVEAGKVNVSERVSHGIENIDRIVNFYGVADGLDTGNPVFPISWFSDFNSKKYFKVCVSRGDIVKGCDNDWNFDLLITIEYTKTTD